MIEVTNLVKRYGTHTAVDHLSFTVEDGQIYGFLGPNGAGKSTTMNMMTGYLAATEGQILINGHDIMEEPEAAKKCIGYLPEIPPLYQDMTVYEYLQFVARLKKLPKKAQKTQIDKVMKDVKITDMASRLIRNLSKGYKQRVGLAQAILGDPEVIILDEPTVGLDPKQIIEIRDLIKSLGKKHTVILSSHILSEVSAVCDHIMIISHGKLVASDTPENLVKMTSKTSDIHLEIKGGMDLLKQALKQMETVDYVECNSYDKASGIGTYTVHTSGDADIREQIFYKMVEMQTPILAMNMTTKSLEDVFLALTEDQTTVPAKQETSESGVQDAEQETSESCAQDAEQETSESDAQDAEQEASESDVQGAETPGLQPEDTSVAGEEDASC